MHLREHEKFSRGAKGVGEHAAHLKEGNTPSAWAKRHAWPLCMTSSVAAPFWFGFRNHPRKHGVRKDCFIGMPESGIEREEVPAVLLCFHFTNKKESVLKVQVAGDKIFKDDLSGQLLSPELVKAARLKEMKHLDGEDVWEFRPIGECRGLRGNHR